MADMGNKSELLTELGGCFDNVLQLDLSVLKGYKETIQTIKKILVAGKQFLKSTPVLYECLIHPSKGFCALAQYSAKISELIQKYVDLKPSLPKEIQKNVDNLKKYMPEIEQLLEKIVNGIDKISQVGKM